LDTHELERVSFTFQKIDWALNHDERFTARLAVQVNLGDAADRVSIQSTGFADVHTDLSTAGGNDQARIRHRMFALVDRTSLSRAQVNLGSGDNALFARLEEHSQAVTAVAAEAGDDFVQIDHQQSSNQGWGKWEVNVAHVLDGDDRVQVSSLGYDRGTLSADLGSGNDSLQLLTFRNATADDGALPEPVLLEVHVLLGSGDDSASLVSRGFRQIATDIDTGPLGDGRDRLLATHIAAGFLPTTRRRNLVTTLSFDLDRAKVITIGYESVEIRTEQTRQISLIQDL
jgi:hypothetical protein